MFQTVADLVADVTLGYPGSGAPVEVPVGSMIFAETMRFEVVASGTTDQDITTAGGVKFYAKLLPSGAFPLDALDPAGDGVTDDYIKLNQAFIACRREGGDTIYLGANNIAFGTQIDVGSRIAIVGGIGSPWRAGTSGIPASTLTWIGGATSMFTCAGSLDRWEGFAVLNNGSATDFITYTSGAINHRMHNLSFLLGTGETKFSRSIIRSDGPRLGYSSFTRINCTAAAPRFIDIDGQGTANGITPFYIGDKCIFGNGGGAANNLTVVHIQDEIVELITIEDCTFNHIVAEGTGRLTVVDTNTNAAAIAIGTLSVLRCEFDSIDTDVDDRFFKLTNVRSVNFDGNFVSCSGTRVAFGNLTGSMLSSCKGNYFDGINGPVWDVNGTSVLAGGSIDGSNYQTNATRGLVSQSQGATQLAWPAGGGFVFMLSELAGMGPSVQEIRPATNNAWTLTYKTTAQGPQALIPGGIIILRIKNPTGGAIANPTLPASIKKPAAMTVTSPGAGNARFYTLAWTGVNWNIIGDSGEVDE